MLRLRRRGGAIWQLLGVFVSAIKRLGCGVVGVLCQVKSIDL